MIEKTKERVANIKAGIKDNFYPSRAELMFLIATIEDLSYLLSEHIEASFERNPMVKDAEELLLKYYPETE